MRFSTAVDSLTKENHFLRTMLKILALACLLLTLTVLFLHNKEPVVVERSSRGLEVVRATILTRSEKDVEDAIRLLVKARFDTNTNAPEIFLSPRQLELRLAEQRVMKTRNLSQSIVVRSTKISKDEALVELDRVLSFGDVRSAIKISIKIAFEEVTPNELNPYGIRLALAAPIDKPTDNKGSTQ